MSPSAQTILQFSYLQLAAEAVDLETGMAGHGSQMLPAEPSMSHHSDEEARWS